MAALPGEVQQRQIQPGVGRQGQALHAGPREALPQFGLARLGGGRKALAEGRVMGVDEHLLAGFGILQHHQPEVRQGDFQWIDQPHGDDFVAPGQHGERCLPARRADEV